MRIAGAALNQTPLDWARNTANIRAAIDAAKQQAAELLLLPEMCLTGYGCEDLFLADWLSEQAWQELEALMPACTNMVVCIGLPLRIDGITYNGVCVIRNQEILGITLKQNLARDGVHYEPRWFDAWPAGKVISLSRGGREFPVGDVVYTYGGISFGFEICEDAWREVRPGERLCQRGVALILNPSASHFAMGKSAARTELVRKSSADFNCTYLYVNLLGNEAGRMIYDGDIILAQKGALLLTDQRLSFKRTTLRVADIDFSKQATPISLAPDLDVKEELAQAAALALFNYLTKSKAKGFVLSLSGGADSSCCAVFVSEMVRRAVTELGWAQFCNELDWAPEKPIEVQEIVGRLLTCAYQGTRNSSSTTLEAARELAISIGARFHHWQIDDEVVSYTAKIETALGRKLAWQTDDIALQNIQARSRSPVIWLLANVKQSILLTTSNRSEGDVGYATMDGDTSGSLAPIAGLDKPFIIDWLKWAEQALHYPALRYVNNLAPTAELRPPDQSQTDEKDLMPYPVLARIERLAWWERQSPTAIYHILKSEYPASDLRRHIQKFFRLWAANQWKRERLAPSFHLDDLNVDPRSWCRFPILSGNFRAELAALETQP
jgi:NAD+ synthase (glutamine-hydrolysing)